MQPSSCSAAENGRHSRDGAEQRRDSPQWCCFSGERQQQQRRSRHSKTGQHLEPACLVRAHGRHRDTEIRQPVLNVAHRGVGEQEPETAGVMISARNSVVSSAMHESYRGSAPPTPRRWPKQGGADVYHGEAFIERRSFVAPSRRHQVADRPAQAGAQPTLPLAGGSRTNIGRRLPPSQENDRHMGTGREAAGSPPRQHGSQRSRSPTAMGLSEL